MKNKIKTSVRILPVLLLVLGLAACAPDSPDAANSPEPVFKLPVLSARPADALAVQAARQKLEPGDEAVVFGQIGAVDAPFFEGFSGFVLGDTALVYCDEMGDDEHCATPWDACCVDPEKRRASRLSVQFIDAEGSPFPVNLQGVSGLEPLKEVVIAGTVADSSTPENMIINASGIYIGN
ncbi:MAG: hypothetical protein ACLFU4_06450 [Opitutales bacterium]